jgi:hypothetical protein
LDRHLQRLAPFSRRQVRRTDCTLATVDHNIPTSSRKNFKAGMMGSWDGKILTFSPLAIKWGYKFQSDFCQLRMVGRIPRASLKRQTPERRLCADFCFSAVSASFSAGHCAFLPVSRGRLLPWKTMSRNLVDFPDGESIGSRQ